MMAQRVAVSAIDWQTLSIRFDGTPVRAVFTLDRFCRALHLELAPRDVATIHLTAAIFAVDRLVRRPRRTGEPTRLIELSIETPFAPAVDPAAVRRMSEIASFLSDDEWLIDWRYASSTSAMPTQQHLNIDDQRARRVCLYSGGLDSMAGLAQRRGLSDEPWVPVTLVHYAGLRHLVRRQLSIIERDQGGHLPLAPLVFGMRRPPLLRRQELSQRTRGLMFCTPGSLVAKALGLSCVEVFENGVGALNMPLMSGMLMGGRSTRGAHPTFLTDIGLVLSELLDHHIEFSLPFRWQTKAEMLLGLNPETAQGAILASVSCVSTSIRQSGKDHCGMCPACVERQLTIMAAGFTDDWSRYQKPISTRQPGMPIETKSYVKLRHWRATAALANSHSHQDFKRNYLDLTGLSPSQAEDVNMDDLIRRDANDIVQSLSRRGMTDLLGTSSER